MFFTRVFLVSPPDSGVYFPSAKTPDSGMATEENFEKLDSADQDAGPAVISPSRHADNDI